MAQAYDLYGDEDGFLYITYASQEIFGYQDGKYRDKILEVFLIRKYWKQFKYTIIIY